MKKRRSFLKGILYRNVFIYNLHYLIKFGGKYNLRYKIAAGYIGEGESVLDVCGADGTFKSFLPANCDYTCIDVSPEFLSALAKKKIKHYRVNLHNGIDKKAFKSDILVMVTALCCFRDTSIHTLLEDFKDIAKRVVIVEDTFDKEGRKKSIIQKMREYVSSDDHFVSVKLFSVDGFKKVMEQHNYKCKRYSKRYSVGYYNH